LKGPLAEALTPKRVSGMVPGGNFSFRSAALGRDRPSRHAGDAEILRRGLVTGQLEPHQWTIAEPVVDVVLVSRKVSEVAHEGQLQRLPRIAHLDLLADASLVDRETEDLLLAPAQRQNELPILACLLRRGLLEELVQQGGLL